MKKHKQTKPVAPPPDTEPEPDLTEAETETPAVADEVPTVTATEFDEARAEAAANYEKFLRVTADLENYRKRVAREKDDLARYTREEVVGALLPVMDNLERAIRAAKDHGEDDSSLLEGVAHTHKQLKRTLEECGLVEVASAAGHPFDPEHHEAVGHLESDEHSEGVIINQVQRGYTLSNRLLRPARVIVSKGPAENAD